MTVEALRSYAGGHPIHIRPLVWVVCGAVAFKSVSGFELFDQWNTDTALVIGSAAVSTIGVIQLALLGVIYVVAASLLLGGRPIRRTDLPLLLLLAYAVASLAWTSGDLGTAMREVLYLALPVGLFLVVSLGVRRESTVRRLGVSLLWILAVVSVASLLYQNTVSPEALDATTWDYRRVRARGISGSPNILAGTLATLMSLALGVLLTRAASPRVRHLAVAGLLAGGAGLVLTYSRSGWIGFAMAVGMVLLIRRRWAQLGVLGVAGAVGMLASGAWLMMFGDWQAFLRDPFDMTVVNYQNAAFRLDMYRRAAGELVTAWSFLGGRGLGSVAAWCAGDPSCRDAGGLHSELLQVWIDLGTIGVALLLGAYAAFARCAWRSLRDAPLVWQRIWGLAALAVIAVAIPRLIWDFVFTGSVGLLVVVAGAIASRRFERAAPLDEAAR